MKRLVLVALIILALGGCGEDDDSTATEPPPSPGEEFTVPATTATPGATSSRSAGAALASVLADVNELAPALESYFRSRGYPTKLDDVVAAVPKAGLKLSSGNSIGGYRYDPDEVEFVLCVENASGAWATYDTAPMTTGQSGETGGCP